jgi:response regulator RpfG family c-di-GMP phosphodiesterase
VSLPRSAEAILLTEDEQAVLKLTAKLLEAQGYTVLAAQTPGEAVQTAENHPGEMDLLITDVVMPEMNGRDPATRLSSSRPKLRSLFTSGYTPSVIAHHGVLEEGAHFIQKPFSATDLAVKVRKTLDAE